eukprot:GILJ01026717.1.p1 GENE.GILJ01026717.1~~GILJ01026717.1.p1  ORF type:complete len:102 (+),score=8.14 GILJ01026717.1:430-735(+)
MGQSDFRSLNAKADALYEYLVKEFPPDQFPPQFDASHKVVNRFEQHFKTEALKHVQVLRDQSKTNPNIRIVEYGQGYEIFKHCEIYTLDRDGMVFSVIKSN